MNETEHLEHIRHCQTQAEAAQARYEASSCFSDKGEADYWRIKLAAAVKAQSDMKNAESDVE